MTGANTTTAATRSAKWHTTYPGLIVILVLHTILQHPHLDLDFWNDELYTLEHFVFKPPVQIVSDYHAPNNHILFSLIAHLWTSVLGIDDFKTAISNPFLLRVLPFLFSLATVAAIYLIAHRVSGKWAACLSGAILVTTIPFFNYATQLRGYSLSMCLAAWTVSAIMKVCYKPSAVNYLILLLCTGACVYTLPSNVYYISALVLCVPILPALLVDSKPNLSSRQVITIAAALLSGVLVAVVLYSPVWKQMHSLPSFAANGPATPLPLVTTQMPLFAYQLLSARFVLLPVTFLGLLLLAIYKRRLFFAYMVVLLVLLAVPFLSSDLLHRYPPTRVFLTAVPVLVLVAGCTISTALSLLPKPRWHFLAVSSICAYCAFVCFAQLQKLKAQTGADIRKGKRSGDLYIQYHHNYFHPATDAHIYWQNYRQPGVPLVEACRMDEELLKYLSWQGWNRNNDKRMSLAQTLAHYDTVDILIERPADFLDTFRQTHPAAQVKELLPGLRQVQILRVTQAPNR